VARLATISPVLVTTALIAWTTLVYRLTTYGSWEAYPAVLALPLMLICHGSLIVTKKPRYWFAVYALGHLLVFIPIWFYSLALISKDSL